MPPQQRLIAEGTPAAEIAVLFRINAQSEVYERRCPTWASRTCCGAARSSSNGPRSGRRWCCCAAPRGPTTAAFAGRVGGRGAQLGGLERRAPAARRGGAGAVGIAGRAGQPGRAVQRRAARGRLDDFNADLEQRAASQHAPTVQGVTLASLHSAKGLEWDAVFLVGLTDQTMPIQHADTPEQLAEERRLFYVGITRARQRLMLSWALARNPGQARRRRPSRFLDGLRPGAAARRAGRRRERQARPRWCPAGGRGDVRPVAGLAQEAGGGSGRARVRGLLRCHAGCHRGSGTVSTAPNWRRCPGSARPSSSGTRNRCSRCSPAGIPSRSPSTEQHCRAARQHRRTTEQLGGDRAARRVLRSAGCTPCERPGTECRPVYFKPIDTEELDRAERFDRAPVARGNPRRTISGNFSVNRLCHPVALG